MSRPEHLRTSSSTNLTGRGGPRQLEGKIGIVTGASRGTRPNHFLLLHHVLILLSLGIGAAIAENLASKGCHVILNYTSESSASKTEELGKRLQADHGIKTISVQADMGSEKGPGYVVEAAKNAFSHPKTGKFQIDIIVQNAGVSMNQPLDKIDLDTFAKQYNINVRGPMLLMQAALPFLPHDRSGRVVLLSSVSSSLGFAGQTVYGGTKAAVEAMSRTWSRELAERCTVNTVNPGPVATDMFQSTTPEFLKGINPWLKNTPLAKVRDDLDSEKEVTDGAEDKLGGRMARDYEIAGCVGMCVSPESGWCTGSVICANGGMKFSA